MSDMWKSRSPPTPLDLEGIMTDSFVLRQEPPNGVAPVTHNGAAAPKLKDQRTLSLKDNVMLFIDSTNRIADRLRNGEETVSFDKDDEDTLDFVTAASNLRSSAYGIETKTRWEVKEMAGNIIPAIATTNAIISGLIVLQALHLLRKSHDKLKNVHLQFKPAVPLSTIALSPPNPQCGVCRDTYALLRCDPARATLGEVVKGLLGDDEREVSVYEGQRLLSDPDWDDNHERTLESLSVTRGKFLAIVDEDGELATISVGIALLPYETRFLLRFRIRIEADFRTAGTTIPLILSRSSFLLRYLNQRVVLNHRHLHPKPRTKRMVNACCPWNERTGSSISRRHPRSPRSPMQSSVKSTRHPVWRKWMDQ